MAVCAHLPWSSEGNARAPPPLRGSDISVHFLKRPAGSQYLWGLMHDGVPQNAQNCTQWAWHHACRNPKDKDTPYCRRNPPQATHSALSRSALIPALRTDRSEPADKPKK